MDRYGQRSATRCAASMPSTTRGAAGMRENATCLAQGRRRRRNHLLESQQQWPVDIAAEKRSTTCVPSLCLCRLQPLQQVLSAGGCRSIAQCQTFVLKKTGNGAKAPPWPRRTTRCNASCAAGFDSSVVCSMDLASCEVYVDSRKARRISNCTSFATPQQFQ